VEYKRSCPCLTYLAPILLVSLAALRQTPHALAATPVPVALPPPLLRGDLSDNAAHVVQGAVPRGACAPEQLIRLSQLVLERRIVVQIHLAAERRRTVLVGWVVRDEVVVTLETLVTLVVVFKL
jgi:hypothetical protein